MASQGEEAVNGKPDISNLGFTPMVKVSGQWEVDKALEKIHGDVPKSGSQSPLSFFHMLERLKTTKREGWRRFGIDRYVFRSSCSHDSSVLWREEMKLCLPMLLHRRARYRGESISDHMYRMSIISMFAPPSLAARLDLNKCMKMCLIHDMAELLVGDITPVDGVAKPEKSRRESLTMDFLTKNLFGNKDDAAVGKEIRDIWDEYEESKTLDSHYVHDVDKMELLLQMMEYERRAQGTLDLQEFTHVRKRMTLPETKAWADELIREREAFWADERNGDVDGEGDAKEGVDEKKRMQDEYYARS
ncbi:hypothetical protein EsDP_00001495 [Epichloe bromicola]|uniref:5'-deoxynucleotidase n=1 Tax=Epichloe bromicola TaxID=79588 RepID=A0ABQ0CI04_9HYPO